MAMNSENPEKTRDWAEIARECSEALDWLEDCLFSLTPLSELPPPVTGGGFRVARYRRKPSASLTKIMSSITEEDRRRTRDRMLIAVKIADALEAKNLSQKAFGELMGKSESEISEWLSGNSDFTVDTLSDISDCLGIRLKI